MSKFYIYRNLHRGGFSIQQNGLVKDWSTETTYRSLVANGCEFRVRKGGKARAKKTKVRNVHAFVVADEWKNLDHEVDPEALGLREVTYHPIHTDTFVMRDTGDAIFNADVVYFIGDKCYIEG